MFQVSLLADARVCLTVGVSSDNKQDAIADAFSVISDGIAAMKQSGDPQELVKRGIIASPTEVSANVEFYSCQEGESSETLSLPLPVAEQAQSSVEDDYAALLVLLSKVSGSSVEGMSADALAGLMKMSAMRHSTHDQQRVSNISVKVYASKMNNIKNPEFIAYESDWMDELSGIAIFESLVKTGEYGCVIVQNKSKLVVRSHTETEGGFIVEVHKESNNEHKVVRYNWLDSKKAAIIKGNELLSRDPLKRISQIIIYDFCDRKAGMVKISTLKA